MKEEAIQILTDYFAQWLEEDCKPSFRDKILTDKNINDICTNSDTIAYIAEYLRKIIININ